MWGVGSSPSCNDQEFFPQKMCNSMRKPTGSSGQDDFTQKCQTLHRQERADERRREDNRFFIMMSMFRPPSQLMSSAPTIQSPMTQSSAQSSQNQVHEFDGQDFLERELARRTYGV
jgi:hypothetical protein